MFSNIYPEFHQLYPQVHIDPMELSVHDQNPLLLSGQLDIGFMTLFESQEKKGLEYLRIAKESLVLAVPSDLAKQMALHGSFSASDSASDNYADRLKTAILDQIVLGNITLFYQDISDS